MSRHTRFIVYGAALLALGHFLAVSGNADEKSNTAAPTKAGERWEGIDDRFDFLISRLVSTDASLDVVNAAIDKLHHDGGKAASEDTKDQRPLNWQRFYASAAQQLFRRSPGGSASRAAALLEPQAKPIKTSDNAVPIGVESPNLKKYQEAYQKDKSAAEASLTGNQNYDELCQRRSSLENEECGLWCEIAFEGDRRSRAFQKAAIPLRIVCGNRRIHG